MSAAIGLPQGATAPFLTPLVEGVDTLRAAYRRRRDECDYLKIPPADLKRYEEKGWTLHKELQSHVWLKKIKSVNQILEDRVWCLFYRMGYPVLNGPNFRITYKKPDGANGSKIIDVFAKDDETVVVVECRARDARGRKSLQKDILETANLQRAFSHSIRSHFGRQFNPRIIWIYATHNIIWSEAEVEHAEANNIHVITENEIQYFEAFIAHIGAAGRYQFLAEFLEGTRIPNLENVRVPAVRGRLGRHTYYSFVVSARHLLKIAFVNHQALNHPDGRPAYQRMINKKRIGDIGVFIKNGGYFPTNILVNFVDQCRFDLLPNKDNADRDIKFGWLYLPSKYKSAWIIDGQHRLYGFSNVPDSFLNTNLFVLAFERMDTKTEADLFITINHEQRSVPKSLLVTLQADLKVGSNDPKEAISAIASALVRSISNDNTSPFFRRFEVPGVPAAESQNLTVAEAVKGLVRSTLLGRALPKKLPSGEKAYWDLGIDNLDIKQNAYKKQQQTPQAKRSPKEAYLDLVDFEKIIKQPNNWSTFDPIFNIPMQGEKGKKYYLAWLEHLNEVRRISAHKSPYRSYSEEDFEFVSWIKRALFDNFAKAGFDL